MRIMRNLKLGVKVVNRNFSFLKEQCLRCFSAQVIFKDVVSHSFRPLIPIFTLF